MFNGILGHREVKRILENMYKSEKVPPFIIFEGPEGVGKASMAYEFAKYLMYDGKKEPLSSPDFYLILPVDNPDIDLHVGIRPLNYDPTKEIKIEKIRILQRELSKKGTFEAKTRVVLILNGENLNIEAQNSFLKTLEEPPSHCVIIMVTSHRESLLPTVYSRARRIRFTPLSIEEFKKYPFAEVYSLMVIYTLSGGSIGRAKRIEDSFVFSRRKEFLEKLIRKDFESLYNYLEEVAVDKYTTFDFLEMFSMLLRDMLFVEIGDVVNEDLKSLIQDVASVIPREKAEEMLNLVARAYKMIKANVQRRYVLLMLLSPLFPDNIRDKYDTLFDYLYGL